MYLGLQTTPRKSPPHFKAFIRLLLPPPPFSLAAPS